MANLDRDHLVEVLLNKGFKEFDKKKHTMYVFMYNDQPTRISTVISHGEDKDLNGPLVSLIQRALKLQHAELMRLYDCPMKIPEYTKLLIDRGFLVEIKSD